VVFQINAVLGKPESMAGSISHRVLQKAMTLELQSGHQQIREAFKMIDFSVSSILIDSESRIV
jgi:hypothetical protein